MRLALLAAVAALLLAGAALPAPAEAARAKRPPVVGIADQKPDMFADTRFRKLRIRHARLYVPWDAMRYAWQVAEVDRWMADARRRKVRPLVTFGHSRVRRRALPTPKGFRREVTRFVRRYRWVREYATWNEANHCGEPVCHRPKLVARYWRQLRLACVGCTVLAAEILDQSDAAAWIRKFKRAARMPPYAWGLHNYVEANRFRTERLREVLRETGRARIWLTEVAGIVKRRSKFRGKRTDIPESPRHAARVMRFLFDRVLPRHRRIRRIYVYHWNSSTRRDSWDSALVGPGGRRRPAYEVLANRLRAARR